MGPDKTPEELRREFETADTVPEEEFHPVIPDTDPCGPPQFSIPPIQVPPSSRVSSFDLGSEALDE
jgi:hypothetical protein